MTNNTSILITGAAGFIGFHTSKALSIKGFKIIGLDNYDPYYDVELKYARRDILKLHQVKIICGDINDTLLLDNLIEKHQITHIIHLAAQAGVRYSLVNPKAYLKTNVDGFLSVLEAVRKKPQIKLVWASSSSVYGLNAKLPYSIDDPCENQASLYGVTKKSNELMARTYHHLFDLDVVGLRFFTVYGPWGRPDMAYYSFSKAIDEGKSIDLYNFGECLRDFTYVDDIVEGIINTLGLPRGCFLFNLGNNRPEKVIKFVEILENLLGKKANKKLLPMQPGDVVATWADIKESEKTLNFIPKTSLEVGLSLFIDWYKMNKLTS